MHFISSLYHFKNFHFLSLFSSLGLLRMQGMILQQMPITAQFRVFQEGIVLFVCGFLSFTS